MLVSVGELVHKRMIGIHHEAARGWIIAKRGSIRAVVYEFGLIERLL